MEKRPQLLVFHFFPQPHLPIITFKPSSWWHVQLLGWGGSWNNGSLCFLQHTAVLSNYLSQAQDSDPYPRFSAAPPPPLLDPTDRGTHRKILRRISGIEKANEKVLEGKAVICLPMQEHIDKELGIAFRGTFVISSQRLQPARLMAEPRG